MLLFDSLLFFRSKLIALILYLKNKTPSTKPNLYEIYLIYLTSL